MGQSPSEVRYEVEEAREHLGDTVEAIAHKVNAPQRAKERAAARIAEVRRVGLVDGIVRAAPKLAAVAFGIVAGLAIARRLRDH